MKNSDKRNLLIAKWLEYNEKQKEITNYLYNHTELFEEKYEDDFKTELFNFFAGKITRYTRDYNKLFQEILTNEDKKELNLIRILGE